MSDISLGRRVDFMVHVEGVDISEDVKKNLISMSYTDNEEDATDDLQIKMEDVKGIWLREWLNYSVQSASLAGALTQGEDDTTTQYRVTADDVIIRSGPGTGYEEMGKLSADDTVDVYSIENGWAKIKRSGKDAYVNTSYLIATGLQKGSSTPRNKGLKVQAVIVRRNWETDGKDEVLDCGEFELDDVSASGPPSEITLKCTSLPYDAQIRETPKCKAWEGYTLRRIAEELAGANNMGCMYESSYDPYYERAEQAEESDISFLSSLCHNAGISLKVTNNIIVLFDQKTYEQKDAVRTIKWGELGRDYTKYKLNTGRADTEYQSCRVSYTDPSTGNLISATAYVEDYKEDSEDNRQLEVPAKVSDVGEALTHAEKQLRLHNKFEKTASFTFPFDPRLVAGLTVELADSWGMWAGKYIITQSKHTIGNSASTTQIAIRKVLEGY